MPFITRLISTQTTSLPPLPRCALTGKVFIVTGSNTGIGLEIARQLASCTPDLLVLAVRNVKAGEAARTQILQGISKGAKTAVEVWHVDMTSFKSVKSFAEKCDTLPRLDGLALNAGVLGGDWQLTEDGHETVAQVNLISSAFLAILLAPKLRQTAKGDVSASEPLPNPFVPRIAFTGSLAAEMAVTKNFDTKSPITGMDDPKRYVGADRYFESKIALHSVIENLIKSFPDLVIADVGPGLISSPLYRDAPGSTKFMTSLLGNSVEKGAKNVTLALLTLKKSTSFFAKGGPSQIHLPYLQTAKGVEFGKNLWHDILEELERVVPEAPAAAGVSP